MRSTRPILLVCVLLAAAGLVWWLAASGSTGPRVAGPLSYETLEAEGGAPPAGPAAVGSTGPVALEPEREPDAPGERTALGDAPPAPEAPARAPVAGRVLDAFGQPVAGATVHAAGAAELGPLAARRLDAIDPAATPWLRRLVVETGPDGRFELPDAPEGELALAVRAPGFAPLRELREPAEGVLPTLTLERSPVLEGRVVDAAGLPVEGAELRVRAPEPSALAAPPWREPAVARTDAGGAFRLDQLAAGPFVIEAEHPEHPRGRLEGATERPGEVQAGLVLALPEGGAVAGRVLGLEPDAEAALEVRARAAGGPVAGPAADLRAAPVEPGGGFRLRGLPAGTELLVTLHDAGAGFGPARSAPVPARVGDERVELRLSAGLTLSGRVADAATGAALERFELRAGEPWLELVTPPGGAAHPEGRFRYEGLPLDPEARSLSLRIAAEGYAPWTRSGVPVPADGRLDLGEVRLSAVPRLTVVVQDADGGAPVAGARVALRLALAPDAPPSLPEALEESSTTDAEGRARLTSRPGDRGAILVRHPDYAPFESDELALPATAIERTVRLSRGGTVLVRVLDEAGEPAAGVLVDHRELERGDAPAAAGVRRRTDAAGALRFEHLRPGRHAFRPASAPGGAFVFEGPAESVAGLSAAWREVAVVEGVEAELALRLAPRGALAGRLSAGGRPLAGASLELALPGGLPHPGFGGASATSGGDGSFLLDDLATGAYELTVRHPARAMPTRVEVRVEPGDNALDLELPEAGVEGRVLGADGAPLAGARVTVEPAAGRPPLPRVAAEDGVLSGPGGGYRLDGLEPGQPLVVVARHEAHQEARSQPFEVEEGRVRGGLDLTLAPAGSLEVRVVRADGGAVPFCRIAARFEAAADPPVRERRELVPEGGRALLEGLTPGAWVVSADALAVGVGPGPSPRAEPVRVEVVAGRRASVELTLP